MKVVDGENLILGRAAAGVAKMLLNGEEVAVINAEKMVMTGNLPYLISKYQQRRERKDKANPENSQKWPRRPDLFVRRIIRGMLPYKRPRGKAAFKRLSVHPFALPKGAAAVEKALVPGSDAEKLNTKYHTVAQLCSRLGFQG